MGFASLYVALAVLCAVMGAMAARAAGGMAQAAGAGDGAMAGFFIALAATSGGGALSGALLELMSKRKSTVVEHAMRRGFARRLSSLDYKTFSAKNSGEGASIFSNDLPLAASFATANIFAQISQISTLAVAAAFMLYMNWWLTLIYFALFPLLTVLQAKISAPVGEKQLIASQKEAEMNAVVADALQNPMAIKSYGLEASVERRFLDSYGEYLKVSMESAVTTARLVFAGIAASMSPLLILSFIACVLALGGRLTLAEFIALWLISEPINSWLMMFSQELASIRIGSASAARLLDFTGGGAEEGPPRESHEGPPRESLEASPHGQCENPADGCAAAFRNVSFGYSAGNKVIDNLSLNIEKGKITALAGESGCGKSTAIKLMLGLYSPDGGSICALPRKSYVPQDSYLFPISVKENILCGMPFDEPRFISACQSAGIWDFISGLPEGYETALAESAANVSGGQKQRIAIARAFYQDADLLLLDESTSALDPATEQLVLQAFCAYVKNAGKTAVVVAHRQAVVDLADNVVELAKGGALA
jgi:ABC-type multidrug transport system fused ATPase/permease subunit